MKQVNVGIINVTGYIGIDLARLLYRHPGVNLVSVTGRSAAGEGLGDIFPHMAAAGLPITSELGDVEVAFSALPHAASAEAVARALERDIKVIDISADFRLKDLDVYREWYGVEHPVPELIDEAVYGLTELYRKDIAGARLIANPGCYPTSAILALAPALKEALIEPDIIIDSKSGVSGAGRTLKLTTHFCEANENLSAYALGGHRHMPEIRQELQNIAENEISLTFLPHLVPMTRGMLSSCYASLRSDTGIDRVLECYREFYRGEPFVRVVDIPPQTKHTLGNNFCLIHPVIDRSTGRLMVISCIDNLVKGGAGQAIQDMNLMLGLPEAMGLEQLAIYP
ncbi:MAG: N-acetyl-gamma-glutamyl-phosphate reductase [Dehalococcoidia bacterium]